MSLLALLPGRDWLYICAFMVLLGGGIGFIHHERQIGAAKVEAVLRAEHAQAAAVAASAIAANQAKTDRRIADTMENVNATIKQATRVAADASATAAVNAGLRSDLAAIRRAAASDSRAAGPVAPASSPVVVLADLLQRASDRATELARLADERGTAGDSCVRQYDSLK
jgi:negative regulator of sigma E activity